MLCAIGLVVAGKIKSLNGFVPVCDLNDNGCVAWDEEVARLVEQGISIALSVSKDRSRWQKPVDALTMCIAVSAEMNSSLDAEHGVC